MNTGQLSITITAFFVVILILGSVCDVGCKDSEKSAGSSTPVKKKKMQDYTDADIERIYEEWEKDEEPLADDELPEHLRPTKPIDFSKLDTSNPENILKVTKKGKTLMMFVTVSGEPTNDELETITKLWHSSLFNMHIESQRFVVDEKRVIFMFEDGSQAWQAKDFLVDQDRCEDVTIENKEYPGKNFLNVAKEKLADVKSEL